MTDGGKSLNKEDIKMKEYETHFSLAARLDANIRAEEKEEVLQKIRELLEITFSSSDDTEMEIVGIEYEIVEEASSGCVAEPLIDDIEISVIED